MFNTAQKKLALSFLLLGSKDKGFVLKALSQECINVLNGTLAELEKIGINSTSVKYLKNDLRIDAASRETEYVENGLLNISAKISDFAKKNGHIPPKKLLDCIHNGACV